MALLNDPLGGANVPAPFGGADVPQPTGPKSVQPKVLQPKSKIDMVKLWAAVHAGKITAHDLQTQYRGVLAPADYNALLHHATKGTTAPDLPGVAKFLQGKGYNLKGADEYTIRSAMADWHLGPQQRDPKAWSKSLKAGHDPFASVQTKLENPPAPSTGPLYSGSLGSVDFGPAEKLLATKIGTKIDPADYPGANLISTKLANSGASLLPASLAKGGATLLNPALSQRGAQLIDPAQVRNLVNSSYDPAIQSAQTAADRGAQQGQQNLADIKSWYGQALTAQQTAATRDSAINTAAVKSVGDSNQAILASLGGTANEGASSVAQAGQANQGTLAALGATQDQYNQDVQPLMKAEAASQGTREAAYQSQLAADAAQRIQDAMSAKSQATNQGLFDLSQYNNQIRDTRASRGLDIAQYNNQVKDTQLGRGLDLAQYNNQVKDARSGRMLSIVGQNNTILDNQANRGLAAAQYNNTLDQQAFSNRLALNQSQIASLLAGGQLQSYQAAATANIAKAAGVGAKPTGFAALKGPARIQLMKDLLASVADKNGHLAYAQPQAQQIILNAMAAGGYDPNSKDVKAFLKNVFSNISG